MIIEVLLYCVHCPRSTLCYFLYISTFQSISRFIDHCLVLISGSDSAT